MGAQRPRTPWENTQSQVTWAHGSSQRLNHHLENLYKSYLCPLRVLWMCDLIFLWDREGVEAVSDSIFCP